MQRRTPCRHCRPTVVSLGAAISPLFTNFGRVWARCAIRRPKHYGLVRTAQVLMPTVCHPVTILADDAGFGLVAVSRLRPPAPPRERERDPSCSTWLQSLRLSAATRSVDENSGILIFGTAGRTRASSLNAALCDHHEGIQRVFIANPQVLRTRLHLAMGAGHAPWQQLVATP